MIRGTDTWLRFIAPLRFPLSVTRPYTRSIRLTRNRSAATREMGGNVYKRQSQGTYGYTGPKTGKKDGFDYSNSEVRLPTGTEFAGKPRPTSCVDRGIDRAQ